MARKHPGRLGYLLPVLTAAVLSVGCSPESEPPPVQRTATVEKGECENQAEVTNDLLDFILQGDIDGDGTEDGISIIVDDEADVGCQAFLVASVVGGIVSEPIWELGKQGGLEVPQIAGVAQIDGVGGIEVLVNEIAGASTQFVGAFTLVKGALERIEAVDGRDLWSGATDGVFPYGGSVGHLEAVDCSDDDHVVVSVALPSGSSADAYEVERRFLTLDGAELVLDKDLTEKVTVEGLEVDDFPEFAGSPFLSCD